MEQKRFDIICVGMALVDSIVRGFAPVPVTASGYRALSGTLNVGGEAVNCAVAAAKLGLRARICCALGMDAAGDMVLAALKQGGVDVDAVLRPEGYETPVSTLLVRTDGSRQSITNGAHRQNFHPERRLDGLAGARVVCLGSLFRAPFDDYQALRGVLEAARTEGSVIFADTKLPSYGSPSLDDLSDLLPWIDYIFPNEDEARHYTGQTEPEAMADELLRRGVRNAVIKLGGQGCLFKNGKLRIRLPAYPVAAVDATGAGDNFIAGFAAALLRGLDCVEALRFANACGAICATAVGASAALRSREQVEQFLLKYESVSP